MGKQKHNGLGRSGKFNRRPPIGYSDMDPLEQVELMENLRDLEESANQLRDELVDQEQRHEMELQVLKRRIWGKDLIILLQMAGLALLSLAVMIEWVI